MLAVAIVVLWSFGRIINPIVNATLNNAGSVGPVLGLLIAVYALLHLAIFGYVCMLAGRSFKRYGLTMHGRPLWEFFLYMYVLVTLLLSLYFLAYEFGLLPTYLQNLLPYPFNVSN